MTVLITNVCLNIISGKAERFPQRLEGEFQLLEDSGVRKDKSASQLFQAVW